MTKETKTCFIVMPISDSDGYEIGHFSRVYEHLIVPACIAAGFKPIRADNVKATNHIVLDILERIVKCDLVICDLSSKNPNVMYELGIRQAFDLPVVLLKDKRTERVFDIQGLRTTDYDESLRIDRIKQDVDSLRSAIDATTNPEGHEVNSLIRLLGVASASLPAKADISADTAMVLANLGEISRRLTRLEERKVNVETHGIPAHYFPMGRASARSKADSSKRITLPSGTDASPGAILYDSMLNEVGQLFDFSKDGIIIKKSDGTLYCIPPDHPDYLRVSDIPF